MKENGTDSLQITHSKNGCQMPSCSPNGKKIAYTEQIDHALALRISDINGENTKTLIHEGMNLMPSWLPDSVHIVWMKVRPSPKHDPATNFNFILLIQRQVNLVIIHRQRTIKI